MGRAGEMRKIDSQELRGENGVDRSGGLGVMLYDTARMISGV